MPPRLRLGGIRRVKKTIFERISGGRAEDQAQPGGTEKEPRRFHNVVLEKLEEATHSVGCGVALTSAKAKLKPTGKNLAGGSVFARPGLNLSRQFDNLRAWDANGCMPNDWSPA
jgi:hypothetical protein